MTRKRSDQVTARTSLYDHLIDYVREHRDCDAVERRLRQLRDSAAHEDLQYAGPHAHVAGPQAYDRLTDTVLEDVLAAVSREALLGRFLDALDGFGETTPMRCAFILERDPFCDRPDPCFAGLEQRRLHPQRWRNFQRQVLPRLGTSPLLRAVLVDAEPIDLWHTVYIPQYQGELDSLFYRADERKAVDEDPGYWIRAKPLPGEGPGSPDRAVFLLYPNSGSAEQPQPPPGAVQEWRALHYLAMGYRLLDHQLAGLAESVAAQRERMLTSLAPGILHHETRRR